MYGCANKRMESKQLRRDALYIHIDSQYQLPCDSSLGFKVSSAAIHTVYIYILRRTDREQARDAVISYRV